MKQNMRYVQRISVIVYYLGLLIFESSQKDFAWNFDSVFICIAFLTNIICLGGSYQIKKKQVLEKITCVFQIKMIFTTLPIVIFCIDDPLFENDDKLDFYKKLSLIMFGQELSYVFRQKIRNKPRKVKWLAIIGIITVIVLSVRKWHNMQMQQLVLYIFFELVLILEVLFSIMLFFQINKILKKLRLAINTRMTPEIELAKALEELDILEEPLQKIVRPKLFKRKQPSHTEIIIPRANTLSKYHFKPNDDLYNLQTPFSENKNDELKILINESIIHNESAATILQSPQKVGSGGIQEVMQSQKNFHKSLFNQFPDGMIILGDNRKIQYINNCTKKLLRTSNRSETVKKLLCLKNYQSKFDEQARFQKLFQVLNQKLSSKFEVQSQIQADPVDENSDLLGQENSYLDDVVLNVERFISESTTVQEEYQRAMNKLSQIVQNGLLLSTNLQPQSPNSQIGNNSQFQRNDDLNVRESGDNSPQFSKVSKKPTDRIKFLYEIKMLCMDRENEDEDQSGDEEFQKLPSQFQRTKNRLLEVTLKPYLFENQPQVFIMIRDVSLFNQFSVLQQVNQNKSKMLYYVAHEFRNPLSTIILTNEALLEKFKLDGNLCKKYFEPVLGSAKALLRLVNDLLDLAQLRAGKFKITNRIFNLKDHIYDIATMQFPTIAAKNLYLKLVVDKNQNFSIKSDPDRIRQIVINLIGNAIKFTQVGGITIEIKVNSNSFEIKVKDTGLGINLEDQKQLFQEFGKLEDKNSINTQGIGLGLMISHIMAQKLGLIQTDEPNGYRQGIKVESEGVGHGCCFSFEIFNHQTQEEQLIPGSPNIPGSPQIPGSPNIAFVHSSQYITQNSGKVIIIFQSNPLYEKRNTIDNYLVPQINMTDECDKLRELDFKKLNLTRTFPQIIDSDEDYCPEGLECTIPTFENQNQFKQCDCAEILIIDDEQVNINTLLLVLAQYSLKIEYAISCESAIEKLLVKNQSNCCKWVKIILMDIEMPKKNGLQATKEIRILEQEMRKRDKNFLDSFILGVSGHGDPEQHTKCLNVGMNDLVSKPLRHKEFILIVQQLVKKHMMLQIS